MKNKKIILALFLVWVVQTSCYAPEQVYPTSMPTPIYAQIPSSVTRGENYSFSIKTAPGVVCHAGIIFFNTYDEWVTEDLPTIEADEAGICKWTWKIPEHAKNGIGEFRGYIEQDDQERNFYPATFCIESCQ